MKSKKRKEQAVQATKDSLKELGEAVQAYEKNRRGEFETLFRDAMIKRFEVAFEYFWKMLQQAAEFEGSEAAGPRPAITEAVRYGWIKDPDFWSLALDARNGSVHDYFGITHEEYHRIITRFQKELTDLLKKFQDG